MKDLGVYVHIPFCRSRCYYCDFISSCLKDDSDMEKYCKYVSKEISILSEKGFFKDREIDTLYFGGGTPSLLKTNYFRSILENKCLKHEENLKEFTIEANPESINENLILDLKNFGLNRVSLGVQSLNDKSLKAINRVHLVKDVYRALQMLEKHNLSISVDLMIGLPYQDKNDIKFFIDEITKFNVNHMSVYMLQLEEGTPLKKMIDERKIDVIDDDMQVEFFNYASMLLKEKGFYRYEVSNFAKKGFEAKHNLKYWQLKDYLGLGIASHSMIGNDRFYNVDNFDEYYSQVDKGELAHIPEEFMTEKSKEEEFVMLSFRLYSGVDLKKYKELFNRDFLSYYRYIIEKNFKFLNISENYVSIKEEYLNTMNSIVVDFID